MINIALYSSFYNESTNVKEVVNSVLSQTLLPCIWVIADDGSQDDTLSLLKTITKDHKWIKLVSMPSKTEKNILTAGKAWKVALEVLSEQSPSYDYYCKLDGDIVLPSNYFQTISSFMIKNHEYRVTSGCVYIKNEGTWVYEGKGDLDEFVLNENPRGAGMMIDRDFFALVEISHFPITAPDDFFNAKALTKGFKVSQLNIPMYQLRDTSKPSPEKRGTVMKYFGASILHVLLLIPYMRLSLKEGYSLLKGYLNYRGVIVTDNDVRKFYSFKEVIKRHLFNV
jgi:glycosyltransferase involved in cell wall biosynthesis